MEVASEVAAMDASAQLDFVNFTSQQQSPSKSSSFSRVFQISADELATIEERLRSKIIDKGGLFATQHDALRVTYEKFKAEYEQRFVELEGEYLECQARLEVESRDAHLYRTKANDSERQLNEYATQATRTKNECETLSSNQQWLISINQNLEAEKGFFI